MNISPDLLKQYMNREISSRKLSELTGYHAASIRRAIKRPPISSPKLSTAQNKSLLIKARKAFRQTLADLPPKEIQRIACVSISTATRIRKLGKQNA